MPDSNELVDAETLGAFADTLRRFAAPVAEVMGPGLSEDEIRSICAEASLESSQDAIAWFTVWDAKPHEARSSTASRFGEVLPGFQAAPLRACVKASVWYREFAEQEVGSLRPLGIELDDLWPRAWLLMFGDGGGYHAILDCHAPSERSLLRGCFREDFSGPDWGKPITSLATWLRNGTAWIAAQECRFDSARDQWLPLQAAHAYSPHFDRTAEPNPPIP